MMKSRISGEIEKGNLIIAILDRHAEIGFYLGKGSGASHQYYTINALSNWVNRLKNMPDKAPKRPYKSYISYCDQYRMARYSEELLEPEHRRMYNDSLEALKLLKI